MAFLITDIRNVEPEPKRVYLFDTNVWLSILESSVYGKNHLRPYEVFFNKIIVQNNGSRIAITGVLLSEIINRCLRDIYFTEYCTAYGFDPKKADFKRDYKSSSTYNDDFRSICASISAYHQHLQFIGDNLMNYSTKKLLRNIPSSLDFNDHLIVKICQEQGLCLVTHDSDFIVEDLDIYTTNPKLLQLVTT